MFRQFLFLYGKLGRMVEYRISRNNFLKKYIYMFFSSLRLIRNIKFWLFISSTLYMFEEEKFTYFATWNVYRHFVKILWKM